MQTAEDGDGELVPGPTATRVAATSRALDDAMTRTLFDVMRRAATPLPRVNSFREAALDELAAHCAADLGLGADEIRFLMGKDPRKQQQHKALAHTRRQWKKRLRRLPARTKGRPRIIVILCEGQAVRSFLHCDVCKKLATWAELCILSSSDIAGDVRSLGPNVHFFPVPSFRRNQMDMLSMYLGFVQTASPTNKRMVQRLDEALQQAEAEGSPLSANLRIWRIAKRFASPADYLRAYGWTLRYFAHIYVLRECANLLGELNADLILNTSATTWDSQLWMRAAALDRMPSIANIISWDNMSTKTLLNEFADTYLIWSEEMEEDFAGAIPFLRTRDRAIVGSPQFEPIISKRGLLPRADFLRRHGLDPEKKLILYTTGSVTIAPHEAECLDAVLTHWRDQLAGRANIMVRMHPKDRQGRYDEVRRKFPEVPFTLAGHRLDFEDSWVPTREDIDLLVNQLHHCDLIVNVASTMTLEGFTIDKPAINIGFTLGRSVTIRYPMEDYYISRHYRDITSSGAARLVNDYAELFAAIRDILDGRQHDVATQRRILRRKCLYIEDSSDRIDGFLGQYVRSRPIGVSAHALARARRATATLLSYLIDLRAGFNRLKRAPRRLLRIGRADKSRKVERVASSGNNR